MSLNLPAVNGYWKSFFNAVAVFLAVLSLFPGCISLVKGEFYLSAGQYHQGEEVFKEEVQKKPEKAENWYYLGRFLMAQEKYKAANAYLRKSVELDPYKDKYYFWLGVSYGGLDKSDLEIKNYKKAIALNPEHIQAHTYLGHSCFRKKQYADALKSYGHALALSENNPSAVYNKALILYRTQKHAASKKEFKRYIQNYTYSPKVIRAASYLNRMGDFTYRIHLLNKKRMVLKKIQFLPDNGKLSGQSRESLKTAAYMLEKNKALELHILVYEKNNIALAKKKAFQIKQYLKEFFPQFEPDQIKISFFGVPEKIRYPKKVYNINSSINLFATPGEIVR